MLAFRIHHKGKKICTAGIGELGVLSAMITAVCHPGPTQQRRAPALKLEVGGLDSTTAQHRLWLDRSLRVGDEIRVRILEAKTVDKSMARRQPGNAAILRAQKKYVEKMAEQFGWKIVK